MQHIILDSYNYCTDSLIEDLAKSSSSISITKLSLRGCELVTDGAIRSLEGLKNLTYLDLNNCKVTDKGLKSLESKYTLYIHTHTYSKLITLYTNRIAASRLFKSIKDENYKCRHIIHGNKCQI